MKKNIIAASVIALSLVLTACGGSADPVQSDASTVLETVESSDSAPSEMPMEYEAEPGNLRITDDLYAITGVTAGKLNLSEKANGDPELIKWLEKADPEADWSFVTLTIDNRDGTENAFGHEIRAYDEAGKEYGFIRPLDLLDPLREEHGDSGFEFSIYERLWELYDEPFAKPGAVKEFVMVTGDKLPGELARVTVSFGGLVGESDAITIADAESQGMPMDF